MRDWKNVKTYSRYSSRVAELMAQSLTVEEIIDVVRDPRYAPYPLTEAELSVLRCWLTNGRDGAVTLAQLQSGRVGERFDGTLVRVISVSRYALTMKTNDLDLVPHFTADHRLITKYRFMKYEEFELDDGIHRVVVTALDLNHFWATKPTEREWARLSQTYVYQFICGRWKRARNEFARIYEAAYSHAKIWRNEGK
jgi:hypothetical protein